MGRVMKAGARVLGAGLTGLLLSACGQSASPPEAAPAASAAPPAIEQVWFLCDAGPAAGLFLATRVGEAVALSRRQPGQGGFGAARMLTAAPDSAPAGQASTTSLREKGAKVGSVETLSAPALLTGLAGAVATRVTLDGRSHACAGGVDTLAVAVSDQARWRAFEDPAVGIVLEQRPIGADAPVLRLEQGVREGGKDSLTLLFGPEDARTVLYAPFAGPGLVRRWRGGALSEEIGLQALALAPPRALGAQTVETRQ
jgi:hypothetical protein